MKNLIIYCLLLCIGGVLPLMAQNNLTNLTDANGRVVFSRGGDAEVQGSPYLPENWQRGVVTYRKGNEVIKSEASLRYNMQTGEPEYQHKGQAYVFSVPVVEFTIFNDGQEQTFRAGFPNVESNTPKTFYEVLYDGKSKLLKTHKASIVEESTYSGPKKRSYSSNETFYVLKGQEITKIKKDKKALVEILKDKSAEVEQYVSTNKLRLKEWSELIQVLKYYDGL